MTALDSFNELKRLNTIVKEMALKGEDVSEQKGILFAAAQNLALQMINELSEGYPEQIRIDAYEELFKCKTMKEVKAQLKSLVFARDLLNHIKD